MKLKVLARLAEPNHSHNGLIGDHAIGDDRIKNINSDRILAEMVEAGLIERRNVKSHKTARPYFITEAGKEHLAEVTKSAMFPEMEPTANWADRHRSSDANAHLGDLLRKLPEFRHSGTDRINEVSQQILTAISHSSHK